MCIPYPSNSIPTWWYVEVIYRNQSNKILYFNCRGFEDPRLVKEWFKRDGREIGYVAASHTLCSTNPNWVATLGPGRSFSTWAQFNNVPWKGDRISIEWGSQGRGVYLNPYYLR
jgi:hypothetical protein